MIDVLLVDVLILPSPGVSLYKFPKDPALRKQWEKQEKTRAKWKVTESSFLCSEHFTEEVTASLASQFGISTKRRLGSTVIFATNLRTLSRLRYATPTRSQLLKPRPRKILRNHAHCNLRRQNKRTLAPQLIVILAYLSYESNRAWNQ